MYTDPHSLPIISGTGMRKVHIYVLVNIGPIQYDASIDLLITQHTQYDEMEYFTHTHIHTQTVKQSS